LEWIERHHPKYIEMLKDMVNRGQLEMLSGGYYEPILAIIPNEDKKTQINKLNSFLEKMTGVKPRGMWLAERVWEPHLPAVLSDAGIDYLVVDDTHFKYAGLSESQLDGYYISEELGKIVKIFPASKFLRYSIPFKGIVETVDYLRGFSRQSSESVVVYADDAEKFGIWPGTGELCYEKKWLSNFFEAILKSADYIRTVHFKDVISTIPSKGRIYLPTASYEEMMEWALPAKSSVSLKDFGEKLKKEGLYKEYGIFIRGGFWRNFLSKYSESNNIHKKMLWVDEKLKRACSQISAGDIERESILEKAGDEILKSQCNDTYWHGVFGGLYLNNLRTAVYKHLIAADKLLDKVLHSEKNWIKANSFDFDKDGYEEFLVESSLMNVYFAPASGGMIYELDYKPTEYNFLNTLMRREEPYHRQILEKLTMKPAGDNTASIHDMVVSKEDGLEKFLNYDWYRRGFLIDHFLRTDAEFKDFAACRYSEQGDFVDGKYDLKMSSADEALKVILERDGHIWVDGDWCGIKVKKEISIPNNSASMSIHYRITNNYKGAVPVWFAVEFNLSMLDGKSDDRYYFIKGREISPRNLAQEHQLKGVREFGIEDTYLDTRCSFKLRQQSDLWLFPIQTVSLSEAGFEKVYQSSVLLPHWKFNLKSGESKELDLEFTISPL